MARSTYEISRLSCYDDDAHRSGTREANGISWALVNKVHFEPALISHPYNHLTATHAISQSIESRFFALSRRTTENHRSNPSLTALDFSADDGQSLAPPPRGTCTVISALVAIARAPRRHASYAVQDVRCLVFAGAMPAEVVTALSELMRVPAILESIEFDGNDFDDGDIRRLALAARESTTLRELTIAHNDVGFGALTLLAHAVCCSRSLTTLCISECEPVPEMGAALGGALGTDSVLQSLIVSAHSLQSHDTLHIARGLHGNTHDTARPRKLF